MVPVGTSWLHSWSVREHVVRIALASLLATALGPTTGVATRARAATGSTDCSDSIQAMINRAAAGSHVQLPACVARESLIVDKSLTLEGQPGTEIRGSDVWSGWHADGARWVSDRSVPSFENAGECRSSLDCREPEQVFVDGVAQRRTTAEPSVGQFGLTPSRHVILGSDPASRLVEVTTRATWIEIKSDDVTVDGVTFRHSANGPQSERGALMILDVNRFTLLRSHLFEAHGALLGIVGGTGHRIEDSEMAFAGQEGFAMAAISQTRVARNSIHDNNSAGFDPFWEAGAGKASRVRGLILEDNSVSRNRGPGLWCDIDCRDVTVSGNRVDHNEQSGIFFEISSGAQIAGNVVWENGWSRPDWGWGAGILVSSSGGVSVSDNILAWNADGISVISQGRTDRPRDAATNIDVSRNVVIGAKQAADTADAYLIAWLQDWPGPLYERSSDNRGSDNRYWTAEPEPEGEHFHWTSDLTTEAAFHQTPVGLGGAYISLDERDRILSEEGIQSRPEEHVIPPQPLSRRRLIALAAAGIAGVAILVLVLVSVLWYARRRRRSGGG